MNITSLFASIPRIGRLLAMAAAVFAIGLLNPPAIQVAMAATIPVAVDQSPLTLRQQIPPDITLMLDDSGSMKSDVMPDEQYVGANPGSPTQSELTSSDVNGVYYNPNTNYGPPVQVDGTQYPVASFTGAWINGFNHGAGTVNLSSYDGSSDTTWTGAAYHNPSDIHYTQSFSVTTSTTPYTPTNCASGYALVGSQCQEQPYKASCTIGYSLQLTRSNGYQCVSNTNRNKTQTPSCTKNSGTDTYSSATGKCTPNPPVYTTPTCNSPSDIYDPVTNLCTPQTQSTYSFFTYTVKNSDGSFTSHYVGLNGTCAPVVAAGDITPAANCDESATTQQNVANWYSYYHTRILMAKSSLMVAFDQVNPSFRIGFGSINDNGASNLSNTFGTAPEIQQVAPFDVNCATSPTTCTPGQSGTTRASFWKWVASEYASDSTPLRIALDQVGQYYQSSQPWTTLSTDPGFGLANQPSSISCRQAYTILTTDGFWNDRFTGPGNADGKDGTQINGANGQSYTYTAAAPYSDSYSNTLADVAMKYWGTDLQTGIANNVPPSSSDPAFWQHMTTFTIGLGFTPTGISPTGTTVPQIFNWANGGASINNFAWPQPSADSINNIADLAHAGLNGHGGFFSATDPNTFIGGLTSALNRATDRVGTGASLAANSTQLQTGTAVFQANYFTGNWKGDLKELAVNPNDGTIATSPTWSAQKQLANSVCTTDSTTGQMTCGNRKIWTYNPASGKFVAFTASVDSSGTATVPALSTAQLNALGATATAQANLINYLRGDNTQEQKNGGGFRDRDWPLGDIVDSQPVYEGTPNANEFVNMSFAGYTYDPNNTSCTSCSPFQDWAVGTTDTSNNFTASAASQRKGVVWVSGNDGMIHAFDATTGNEVYAYLPGALMINSTDPAATVTLANANNPLANLADPSYGSTAKPHQLYNDGELTIADAYVKLASDTAAQWHSILVGTTGRGPARAVYALDVTDPTNVKPLWERYNGDSSSLDSNSGSIGQMAGKPVIAQTGDYGTTPAWSVLIGNGYNSTSGTAALLQFDLATGQLYVHATDSATSNGLAAPLAWMDTPSSGMADVAYAGDLLGRVWSIPLISVSTSGGNSGNSTTSYTPSPSAGGVKLFTATTASGGVQPITAGVWGAQEPTTGNPAAPNPNSVWLFFGTGKYLTQADITDASVQSWYGIMAQTTAGSGPNSAYSRTSSSVIQRNIIAEQAGSSSPFRLPARAVTQPNPTSDPYSTTDMKGMKGWVMDLVSPTSTGTLAQGERMVSPNQLQGNLLIGTTRIPTPAGSVTDPCNPAGSGWIMAVNPFSGTGPITNFFDTNNDGNINGSDTITVNGQQVPAAGVGFTSLPNAPIFVGGDMLVSFDNGTTASLKTNASSGGYSRVSWQELITP